LLSNLIDVKKSNEHKEMIMNKILGRDYSKDYIAWLDKVWSSHLPKSDGNQNELVFGILLWPGFTLMSLTGILECLRHTNEEVEEQFTYIKTRWEILGSNDNLITSSCGLSFDPTMDYVNPNGIDYVVVIGGPLDLLNDAPRAHFDYLRLAYQMNRPIIGVCTGSFILAQEGFLDRKTACIHPSYQKAFQQTFPRNPFVTHKNYCIESPITTVPGGISILTLMSHIIATHMGSELSTAVLDQISLPSNQAINEFDRSMIIAHREIKDPRIQKSISVIEKTQEMSLTVKELAAHIGMSERHFCRLFTDQLGVSPKEYLLTVKLRLAIWLLQNTTKSVTSIAYDAGFSSISHLSTLCSKRFAKTPSQIRKGG